MFIDAFSALLVNLGASIREYFDKRSKQAVQQNKLASLSYYKGVTLSGSVKVGTRLNFAMVFADDGAIFLRVSGQNQCQSEHDWPIMI